MLSDYQNITIIAESLYEQLPRIINGEEKAVLLREFLADNNYDILRVFGNTKGDFAMLKMAEEPFWVNKTGEVSVWKEFVDSSNFNTIEKKSKIKTNKTTTA